MERCSVAYPLLVIVITAVLRDNADASAMEIGRVRTRIVTRKLLALGIPETSIYQDVVTEARYAAQWAVAPSRAIARADELELQVTCNPK